jgi:hypothetical protein
MRISELCILAACAVLAAPTIAHADAPSAEGPVTRDASMETAPVLADATARFAEGLALYDAGSYEKALAAFSASYAIAPSPNSRLYVARCLRQLGRLPSAWAEYGRVAEEATARAAADVRYAATADAAREERTELRGRLGFLRVAMPVDASHATLTIAGELVSPSRWGEELAVSAGTVEIRAISPGRRAFVLVARLGGGDVREVHVELPATAAPVVATRPAPADARPLRTVALVGAGIGLAGMATWAIFGVAASRRYTDLALSCGGHCGPERADEIAAGRRESTAASVGLGVGIAGVTGGVALFLADRFHVQPASRVRVGVAPGAVSVGGAF